MGTLTREMGSRRDGESDSVERTLRSAALSWEVANGCGRRWTAAGGIAPFVDVWTPDDGAGAGVAGMGRRTDAWCGADTGGARAHGAAVLTAGETGNGGAGAEVAGSLNDDRFRRTIEARRIAGDIASSLVASSSGQEPWSRP